GDDGSVDRDAARDDQLFGGAAGGDSGSGEELLQPLLHGLHSSPPPATVPPASGVASAPATTSTPRATRASASADEPSSSSVGNDARSFSPKVSRNSGVVPY